jgi:predicted dehydrogenase
MTEKSTRRNFLQQTSLLLGAATSVPYFFNAADSRAEPGSSPHDRPNVGCIGNGGMGGGDARAVSKFGNIVALCDVDRKHSETLNQKLCQGKATLYDDHRKLLDRRDIEIVTISTPDHWHVKIAIDALRAGKDVYCQKPLTLTIDEGQKLCRVLDETKRVLQVGTQQRSENDNRFLKAVALVQGGRIGKVKRVTCAIGGGPTGGPFKKTAPPAGINWERWLGQAPLVDYLRERCHGTFRWWYEYSGGKLTDWGAHHVDIAQWAIGMEQSGPLSVEPLGVRHPQMLKHGMPTKDDCYNTANTFVVRCLFANGVELLVSDDLLPEQKDAAAGKKGANGILFEGEKGRFFVNRGSLKGEPVDELASHPIPDATLIKLRKGKPLGSHMENFILCVKDRSTPVSDAHSHHRVLTTCHLANIANRLGRKIQWDPETQQIQGDPEAASFLSRKRRKGYEIEG